MNLCIMAAYANCTLKFLNRYSNMKINFWKIIIWFWILFVLFVAYIYFFQPDIFRQMFGSYTGPGSPFINNP